MEPWTSLTIKVKGQGHEVKTCDFQAFVWGAPCIITMAYWCHVTSQCDIIMPCNIKVRRQDVSDVTQQHNSGAEGL